MQYPRSLLPETLYSGRADYLGDSLGLPRTQNTTADLIVFRCHFLAETAKSSPTKGSLPELKAECHLPIRSTALFKEF